MVLPKLKICSYNCNGLGDHRKRNQIFTWLKDKSYDIYCLQESHSTPLNEERWKSDWGGPILFNHGLSNSRGVLILFKKNLIFTVHQTQNDNSGRWMLLDLTIDLFRFSLANIYAPNTDNPSFFVDLENNVQSLTSSGLHTIIVGDFNTALNSNLDRAGHQTSNYHPNCLQAINSLCANLDLVDIYRYHHPTAVRYTWRRRLQASRIDYFLTSFSLTPSIENVKIEDSLRSDHSLISISLLLSTTPKGPGFWRLNCDLLSDQLFVKETSKFITEFFLFNEGSANPHIVWEAFKCTVRGQIIKFSSWKFKQNRNTEILLIDEIKRLQEELDSSPDDDIFDQLQGKKQELEIVYQTKSNNLIMNKRAKWMEQGEKCTKFFMNLNGRGHVRKNMTKLVKPDSSVVIDPEEILRQQTKFYADLYTFKDPPMSLDSDVFLPFFPQPPPVSLFDSQRDSCEGFITEVELKKAIESFSVGKSPGLDGLPIEFYRVFFQSLKQPLLASFNHSFQVGCLSDTQKTGLITLLLKQDSTGKDKEPSHIKNWRPVTLLNCDNRILSKCLALRMKNVISSLVSYDQTGFMKGRSISDTIRRLLEIIEYYDRNEMPGLIFCADFEKAFDKIRHDFIFKVLKYFGFGDSFITWIKVLYKDTFSKIINNGYISESFALNRGVRQGCPISPYLFVLGVELLAMKIRSNIEIQGLTTYGLETKLLQFADDSNFPLVPKLGTLYALVKDIEVFSTLSGLVPNFDKCMIVRIGSLRDTNFFIPCLLPLQWTDGPVDILGIHIPKYLSDIVALNFDRKESKIDKLLNPWKGKLLSLLGKVTLINSLIVSQFIFLFQSLPSPPPSFFERFEKKIFKFLWSGGPERVKRKTVYNLYEYGGLKLRNLQAVDLTLKASWVPKLYHNDKWFCSKLLLCSSVLFTTNVFPFSQLTLRDFEIVMKEKAQISQFFRHVIQAWLKFQLRPPETAQEVKQQPICLNSHIRISGKPCFLMSLYNRGVVFVNDILDSQNKLLTFQDLLLKFGDTCAEFKYNQIISAIPSNWKHLLRQVSPELRVCVPACRNINWLQFPNINKHLYSFFMSDARLWDISDRIQYSWGEYLNTPIQWKIVYSLPYKVTIDSQLRMFQYKLLFKFLTTNKILHRWGVIDTSLCSYCTEEEESDIHLFWDCRIVTKFWIQVQDWYFKHTGNYLHLTLFNVLFGIISDRVPALSNFVILLGKHFIFKYRNRRLSLESFISYMSYYFKLENIIARRLNKTKKHIGKWGKLIGYI